MIYLTVQEVADLARCEHKTVRRAIRAGTLRACGPTRKILVRDDDARAWIEDRPSPIVEKPRTTRPIRPRSTPSTASVAYLKQLEREAS